MIPDEFEPRPCIFFMPTNLLLASELLDSKSELERIKTIIKTCDVCGIIDGNDMCDWGWKTIKDHNNEIHAIKVENKRLRDLLASAGVVDPESGKFKMSGWNP